MSNNRLDEDNVASKNSPVKPPGRLATTATRTGQPNSCQVSILYYLLRPFHYALRFSHPPRLDGDVVVRKELPALDFR